MNAVKTLFYMGIMHGLFTFYFPYQLASFEGIFFDFGIFRHLAFPLWFIGTLIIIWCSVDIIRKGRGTPAHLDPPKTLIINGLYRHVRNPIYFGAIIVLLGYVLWFASARIMLYTSFAFIGLHFLIVIIEEPILKNTFGAAYDEYRRNVPRWIPRLK